MTDIGLPTSYGSDGEKECTDVNDAASSDQVTTLDPISWTHGDRRKNRSGVATEAKAANSPRDSAPTVF